MTETRVNALITHMLTTFPNGSEVGGYPLQVIDGPGALDIRNNVLFIGHSVYNPTYSASASQEWAAVGRIPPSRKESLDLNCSLRVGIGNRDMAGCRARAIAIFEAIAYAFRASVAAFSANGEFQQIQLSRYRMYQEYTNDGVSITLEFSVTATARV